jgi:hypothetical protein
LPLVADVNQIIFLKLNSKRVGGSNRLDTD